MPSTTGLAIHLRIAATALCLLLVTACGLVRETPAATPAPVTGNVITNGGFEQRGSGWASLDPAATTFTISDDAAHAGDLSLELRIEPAFSATLAAGAVQRVSAAEFPAFVSGFYRAERWLPAGAVASIELVVRVTGGGTNLRELRLVLAGPASDPLLLPPDARYAFIRRAAPTGDWTYFSHSLTDAWLRFAGGVPVNAESIEISLEARAVGGTASATVLFDDLFAGRQLLNPNRPDAD